MTTTRATRGEGSVTRLEDKPRGKCRKWKLRVSTDSGRKERRFTGSYTEAKQALQVFVEEVEAEQDRLAKPILPTFSEYARGWIEYREKLGTVAKRTIKKNKNAIRALNWHLATRQLTDITPQVIREAYVGLKEGESLSGKCLSGTYLSDIHIVLNQIMNQALKDKLIPENPCASMQDDKPRRDTKEKEALSAERVLEFENALDNFGITAHTIAVQLAVFGGLRRSEICALRWCDYDGMVLDIKHGTEDNGDLKATKSKSSARQVPLDKSMQNKLDIWYKLQSAEFGRHRISHNDETRIITTELFGVMQPWNLGRWWNRNRERFGLVGVTLHELRHTYLTLLVHSGANLKVAQSIAGHAELDVLMNIYTHRNRDAEREAVDKMMDNLRLNGATYGDTETPTKPKSLVSAGRWSG